MNECSLSLFFNIVDSGLFTIDALKLSLHQWTQYAKSSNRKGNSRMRNWTQKNDEMYRILNQLKSSLICLASFLLCSAYIVTRKMVFLVSAYTYVRVRLKMQQGSADVNRVPGVEKAEVTAGGQQPAVKIKHFINVARTRAVMRISHKTFRLSKRVGD